MQIFEKLYQLADGIKDPDFKNRLLNFILENEKKVKDDHSEEKVKAFLRGQLKVLTPQLGLNTMDDSLNIYSRDFIQDDGKILEEIKKLLAD